MNQVSPSSTTDPIKTVNTGRSDDRSALQTMSSTRQKLNDDLAQEDETDYRSPKNISAHYAHSPTTIALSDEGHNKKYAGQIPPSVARETSTSGDVPDPEADADTLDNAQFMGMQSQEDLEHPRN